VKEVKLYRRFGQFWHWTQTVLVLFLSLTGFEVHGSLEFFGYKNAVTYHSAAAVAFVVLTIFAIFWHFTTGEWKQYVPTRMKLGAQLEFYLSGIFKGEPHPWHKTADARLNPMQRITYVMLKVVLFPLLISTGLFYLLYRYNIGGFSGALDLGGLRVVGLLHTAGAWLMLTFLVVHIYLTSTGETVTSNLGGMISGSEELEDDEDTDSTELHDGK